jgi:integrase
MRSLSGSHLHRRLHNRLLRSRSDHRQAQALAEVEVVGPVHPRRAKALRDELAVSIRRGEFVQPSKQTLAQWLNVWLDESVRSARRGNTVLSYQSLIANHIIPALGGVQLQALRSGHLSKYYAEKARRSVQRHTRRPPCRAQFCPCVCREAGAGDSERRRLGRCEAQGPHGSGAGQSALLVGRGGPELPPAATDVGPQLAALFSLALDSGARRGELLGPRWADVDLDAGTLGRCMSRAASMTGRGLVTPSTRSGERSVSQR